MKNMTTEEILDIIAEDKECDEIAIELNLEEVAMLEECRDEFCHEVGRIYGNCKMDMEDTPDQELKMFSIKRTRK